MEYLLASANQEAANAFKNKSPGQSLGGAMGTPEYQEASLILNS